MIIIVLVILITALYVALMILYIKGWYASPVELIPATYQPSTRLTVIIPARNERDNIGACLESILHQLYPSDLLEIVVVDDHSNDGTPELVAEYAERGVKCISLAEHLDNKRKTIAYKKEAITAGVNAATGELIVTTDADCVAPNMWLLSIVHKYERSKPAMIIAPVIYSGTTGLLKIFQLIDFMGMQGVTAATHALDMGFMSNGANLAYQKEIFQKVGGYEGVDHLASGDDYLLLMKVAKNPFNKIAYLKSEQAIMTTQPQHDWYHFMQQRIRWSSKSGKYGDHKITAALLVVYLFNFMLFTLGICGFFESSLWFLALIALGVKIAVEYVFLIPVTSFFHRNWTRGYFPFLQPLHIVYITIAGFLGFFGQYTWKDRNVR